MLLRNTKGYFSAMLTSFKVCVELQWASDALSGLCTWFQHCDITSGNMTVWILTTASEESINHPPPWIFAITTAPNQKIKGDS